MERYKLYNNYLVNTLQLDWYDMCSRFKHIGNGVGIYTDVAMLFEQIASRPEIGRIVEFGSGGSTIYWAKAAQKYGKVFVSYEEEEKYKNLTQMLIDSYRIDVDLRFYDQFENIKADAIFLDSQSDTRTRMLAKHEDLFLSSRLCLVDDCEDPFYSVPIVKFFASHNRPNFFSFNPIGRADRTVLINSSVENEHLSQWVWSWRPDTKGYQWLI